MPAGDGLWVVATERLGTGGAGGWLRAAAGSRSLEPPLVEVRDAPAPSLETKATERELRVLSGNSRGFGLVPSFELMYDKSSLKAGRTERSRAPES